MKIGDMRFRVTFQSSSGDDWNTAKTWTNVAVNVFAGVMPKTGREIVETDKVTPQNRVEIYIRYRTDITTAMRALLDGNIYHIEDIKNHEQRNRFLVLTLVDVGETT